MPMTKKEQSLLKDLQNEEKLCAEKYSKAAEAACDPALKTMLGQIAKAEQNHYDTVTQMLNGTVPSLPGQSKMPARGKAAKDLKSAAKRAEKQQDAYLLADLLATEKYVAGVYNTSVFEFSDAKARGVLMNIQQQEQQHGKEIAEYMQANNMSC